MKHRILSIASILAFVGFAGCGADEDVSQQVDTRSHEQNIATNAISPLIWPLSPIAWEGNVGTWPLAVWADQPINWLAFDIPGATNLSLSLASMDGLPLTGFTAGSVDAALLSTVSAGPWLGGLVPPLGLLPWASGLSTHSSFAVPGYIYGLNFWPDALAGLRTSMIGIDGLLPGTVGTVGIHGTGLSGARFLSPTLTSNALMLNSLPTIVGTTPFVVNVRFDALDAASMPSLNVFSSMASTNAALQGGIALQSAVFPIIGMPSANIATPAIIPPVITPSVARTTVPLL